MTDSVQGFFVHELLEIHRSLNKLDVCDKKKKTVQPFLVKLALTVK